MINKDVFDEGSNYILLENYLILIFWIIEPKLCEHSNSIHTNNYLDLKGVQKKRLQI